MNTSLLLYCRPGFEKECAQEISHYAETIGVFGHVRAKEDRGWLQFVPNDPEEGELLRKKLRFACFTFIRQWVHEAYMVSGMLITDRATPVAEAAASLGETVGSVWIETADTNEAKELSAFCRKFSAPLEKKLRRQGTLVDDPSRPRLHVFFVSDSVAFVGLADTDNSAAWPMGIPRLRAPAGAPSRSAQKLAEALHVFLTPEQQAAELHEGITAVDLGAAPGGWTWVLLRHGLSVTAIDNGSLAPALQNHVNVEHLRADGLLWRPKRPVHWLVCDMAERPSRVAALIADWLAEGHCQSAIFNLKLPMKKRYEEVELCRDLMLTRLAESGIEVALDFRQLYHDREEVTGFLRHAPKKSPRGRQSR